MSVWPAACRRARENNALIMLSTLCILPPRSKSSMEERVQRSRLLAARDEFVQRLGAEAKARLVSAATANAPAYSALLKGLIKQGIVRLAGENVVEVRARPQDLAAVQKAAPLAAAEVAAEARAAGTERSVAVTVVPWPQLGASAGGVQLAARGGTIRCDDSLEERLTLVLADLTPVVRDLLFPSARAEVRVKPPVIINPHSTLNKNRPVPRPAPAQQQARAGADPFAF